MSGSVSDSYDPEFSTAANAFIVRQSIQDLVEELTRLLGADLKDIIQLSYRVQAKEDTYDNKEESHELYLTESKLRILRFALLRSIDTI